MSSKLITFVIPLKDEQHTINELHDRIRQEVKELGHELQMIFIDDGSTDDSWNIVAALCEQSPGTVQGIRFRRNLGKAAALAAGFKEARGELVFTMDADLQDDPKEIRRFINKLEEGFDVVSGWKRTRHDPWHKVLPSRVFNALLSKASGVKLHDHNCGFKCYRSAVVKELNVYGEMHRMLPSLAGIRGFKSTEIEVEHHARRFGQSKYGIKRFLRGFMDMLTVWYLRQYRERPLHLLGGICLSFLGLCAALLGASLVLDGRTSAFLLSTGITLAATLPPLLAIGFLAELIISRRSAADRNLPILQQVGHFEQPKAAAAPLAPPSKARVINFTSLAANNDGVPLVLVSDDDPYARRLISYHLESLGFRVIQASNGPETLAMMSQRPTIVLLDLMLPGMDGLQCLKHIRNEASDTKVIMISAHGQIRQAVGAMKLGAYDYIAKPFDPEQLINTVRRASKEQTLVREHVEMDS